MFIQTNTPCSKEQLEFFSLITEGLSWQGVKFIKHLLICQLNSYWQRKDGFDGVPIPSTWIERFTQRVNIKELVELGLIKHTNYSIVKSICRRFVIHETIFNEFLNLGASSLIKVKQLKEPLYNLKDGSIYNKNALARRDSIKSTVSTPFNAFAVIYKLRLLQDEINNLGWTKQREILTLRLAHATRCFQSMLCRTVIRNYKTGIFEYIPEYVEPERGCRKYEVGGGLLGLPRDIREIATVFTDTVNYDAVKCHATIAHIEIAKAEAITGLEDYLNNKITSIVGLSVSTIKTATLAILNGAKIPRHLNQDNKLNTYTLQKLVFNDPLNQNKSHQEKLMSLIQLGNQCKKLATNVKKWFKTITTTSKMSRTSERMQKIEQQYLKDLHDIGCNYQHDGTIIKGNVVPQEMYGPIRVVQKNHSSNAPTANQQNVLLHSNLIGHNTTTICVDTSGNAEIKGAAIEWERKPGRDWEDKVETEDNLKKWNKRVEYIMIATKALTIETEYV